MVHLNWEICISPNWIAEAIKNVCSGDDCHQRKPHPSLVGSSYGRDEEEDEAEDEEKGRRRKLRKLEISITAEVAINTRDSWEPEN